MESSATEGWLTEAVVLRPRTGRERYLLEVRRERCGYCATGVRTVSIWVTAARTGGVGDKGEEVAWCGHCFNATCEHVALHPELEGRHQAICCAVTEGRVSRPWSAVRPALEDLERRGLL